MLIWRAESLTSPISFSHLDINPLTRGHSLVISNVRSDGNHSRHKATRHTYISLMIGHGEKLSMIP